MPSRPMMNAAVLHGPGDIRYELYPIPEVIPGYVKIRVRAAGICGSDIPRVLGNAAHFFPVVLGHEFSGDVTETGEGVTRVQNGDRVVVAPLVPCGACDDCQEGAYALCRNYTFIGSRVQGGFAEYVLVPEMNVIKFPSHYAYEQAALFEPSCVAIHGLIQCGYRGGRSMAVIGAGTIGILTAQWAQLYGATGVTLFDVDDKRLAIAESITGAQAINTVETDGLAAAMQTTGQQGFDYVVNATSAPPTIPFAYEIAANKAAICFIGTPTGDVTFTQEQWEHMNRREFYATGSWMSYSAPFPGREWTLTTEMVGQGRINLDQRLIDRTFPLSACAEAFDLFKNPDKIKGKVLFTNNIP